MSKLNIWALRNQPTEDYVAAAARLVAKRTCVPTTAGLRDRLLALLVALLALLALVVALFALLALAALVALLFEPPTVGLR